MPEVRVFHSWGDRFRFGIGRFMSILFLQDSRKVGFGLWGFIIASALIWRGKLDGSQWIEAYVLSSALVGGGTVADKWLDQKAGKTNVVTPPTA